MRHRYVKGRPLVKFDGDLVTEEDFKFLYITSPEKNSFATIANVFGVEPIDVYLYSTRFVNPRKEDMGYWKQADEIEREAKEKYLKELEAQSKEEEDRKNQELWDEAVRIYGKERPEPVEHKINKKSYYDYDLVKLYDRRVKAICQQLASPEAKKKEVNAIRSVDLSAMRLHRGLDMFKFSEVSGIPYKSVVFYEKTKNAVIPKEVSDIYFKSLNISKREFRKILECLSGERKTMFEEESRGIPDTVREYVWKRDGGKCKKCSRQKYLHFHHIVQFAKGGKHEAKNLKLLCVACHAEEHKDDKGYHMLKAQAEKLLGRENIWASSN